MSTRSIRVISICFLAFTFSCREKVFSPAEFLGHVDDPRNAFIVTKDIQNFHFTLKYLPVEYLALKRSSSLRLDSAFLSKQDEIDGLDYFTFKISQIKSSGDILNFDQISPDQFKKRILFFSSEMQSKLFLVNGGDTLKCKLFHFERTYGLAKDLTFSLGFESISKRFPKKIDEIQFLYSDNVFDLGPVWLTLYDEAIYGGALLHLPK